MAAYNRQPIEEIKLACSLLGLKFIDMVYEKYTYVLFVCEKHCYKGIQKINREALNRWAQKGYCLCDQVHRDTEDLRRMPTLASEVEILGEYQKSNIKLECCCKICGHHWQITPNKLQAGEGCPVCKWQKISKAKKKSHQIFVEELKKIQPNLELLTEYEGTKKPVVFRCNVCGLIQKTNGPERLLYLQRGCKKCKASNGERKISSYLDQHNITYEAEKQFSECRSKRPLRFDFYLPSFNICIEYQGEQHYRPVDFAGSQEEEIINIKFQSLKERDEIKKEFCKKQGIKLIEIPYWNNEKIQDILDNLLGINDCKP